MGGISLGSLYHVDDPAHGGRAGGFQACDCGRMGRQEHRGAEARPTPPTAVGVLCHPTAVGGSPESLIM